MGFVKELIEIEFEVLVEKAKVSNNLEYEEIKIKINDCHNALFILSEVSQQRELLIAYRQMIEFDLMHENIEKSVDYFLKHKESYL